MSDNTAGSTPRKREHLLAAAQELRSTSPSESLVALLGTGPDGHAVRLALGVESAGVAGMNCAITRWWPGADEQTGLLTLMANSVSAGRPSGDLDIIVSRQPQMQPQRELAFPHTKVSIEHLRRYLDDLMKERRRVRRDAGSDSIEECRRRGLDVPYTLLVVDLPDHRTLAYLGGQLRWGRASGIFTLVTMRDELLPTADAYGTGPTVPPDWIGRFIGAAVQMESPGPEQIPDNPARPANWATLYTWHPPFQGVGVPESPAARVKSQVFQLETALSA